MSSVLLWWRGEERGPEREGEADGEPATDEESLCGSGRASSTEQQGVAVKSNIPDINTHSMVRERERDQCVCVWPCEMIL